MGGGRVFEFESSIAQVELRCLAGQRDGSE